MHKRVIVFLFSVLTLLLFALYADHDDSSDAVLDLLNGVGGLVSCSACLSLLVPLKTLARSGDDVFTRALVEICTLIQEPDVCQGALGSQAPIIAHALRGMSVTSTTANLFCSKIFGLCPYPAPRHYDMRLPLPKSDRPSRPPSRGRKPFRVVHISDVHIDRQYAVGSEADCGRTMCCRVTEVGPGSPGKEVEESAGPYGNLKCDAPPRLHASMLDAINEYASDASMMIFTGDIVDHAVWSSNEKDVVDGINEVYSLWAERLDMPIYGVIGNHDVSPTNSFPHTTSATTMSSDWVFRLHANLWRPSIGARAAQDSAEHLSGSYAVTDPKTGLRILQINTIYGYKANWWNYSEDWEPDPNGLLAWLASELQQAEDAGQRVWIIGHMSAGKSDALHEWSTYYNQLIERYHETIASQAFGHSHRSEYEISYLDYRARTEANAISITYIAPALTPASGNPAFRVYDVDPDTFDVLDYTEYFSNMTDPSYQSGPTWKPYYSARDAYAPLLSPPLPYTSPLDARLWHRVTDVFEKNETAFQDFAMRLHRGYKWKACGEYCRRRWIAHLRAGNSLFNGDTVPLGLHIDSAEAVLPLAKRGGRAEEWWVDAPGVEEDELDPKHAGCSLHGYDAGAIMRNMLEVNTTVGPRSCSAAMVSAAPRKRASSVSHNGDSSQAPSSSKRARKSTATQADTISLDGSDDEANARPQNGAANDDDEDEQVDEDENMDMEADEEEEELVRKAAQKLTQKDKAAKAAGKSTGSIAEAGIIEQLEIQNFMNHTYLTFDFGPRVNFIIGRNGSGKSAVLTALTVGLGGTAAATSRGSSLAGLIKDGKERADIMIRIKNRGSDAYKPETFGKQIIIRRSFTRTGSSTYKIGTESGEIYSTKRADLQKILDHLHIQIDNPICILGQEDAKRFLASKTPKQKYEAFLVGTMLKKLALEYDEILQTIRGIQSHLARNKDALPALQQADTAARDRYRRSEAAITQETKLKTLKNELAWSYVTEIEDSLEKLTADVMEEEEHIPVIQAAIDAESEKLEAAGILVTECEAKVEAHKEGDTGDDERYAELRNIIKEKTESLRSINGQRREANNALTTARKTVADFQKRLDAEQAKLDAANGGARARATERIAQFDEEVRQLMQQAADNKKAVVALEGEREAVMAEFNRIKDALTPAQENVMKRQADSNSAQRARNDRMHVFGQQTTQILQAISRAQWDREPLGPLGRYVTIKDKKWTYILEATFGANLSAFLVTTDRDQRQLSQILRQAGCTDCPIIKKRDDPNFRFEHGIPDRRFTTVLDVLEIENEFVRNVLIDLNKIESSILIDNQDEANHIMRTEPAKVQNCYTADMYRVGGLKSGSQMIHMKNWRGPPRMKQDLSNYIAQAAQALHDAELQYQEMQGRKNQLDQQLRVFEQRKQALINEQNRIRPKLTAASEARALEQEKLRANEPVNLGHLEDGKKAAEEEIETIKAQFVDIEEAKKRTTDEQVPLVAEREAIDKRRADRSGDGQRLQKELLNAAEARTTAQHHRAQRLASMEKQRKKIREKQAEVDDIAKKLKTSLEDAAEICAREDVGETPKSPHDYIKEIKSLEATLKKHNDQSGGTPEQLKAAMIKARDELTEARTQYDEYSAFTQALKASHQARTDRWHTFLNQMSIRSKIHFSRNLAFREFTGSLKFEHDKSMIDLRVQTNNSTTKAVTNSKNLSGGEKSFATISLLLSMWDCISCPLRCLDEFDVFMDNINRNYAIQMIMDIAEAAQGKQYIFITPSPVKMSALTDPAFCKISKMSDPERSQGTLAFGRS